LHLSDDVAPSSRRQSNDYAEGTHPGTESEDATMASTAGPDGNSRDRQTYEIRLQGHLNRRWADWLDGMAVTCEEDGSTTLNGPLTDQAALHGVLNRLRDLGTPIISVRRLDAGEKEA
jgi:hypothetical protein